MNSLHEQFIAEARELVQQAVEDVMTLEREGFAKERVDSIFRAFHTLKGSAGMVGLPAMSLALHAAEDVLAAIRAGDIALSHTAIDAAFACLDQVSDWVEAFARAGALPASADEAAVTLKDRLRGLLSDEAPLPHDKAPNTAQSKTSQTLPSWVEKLIAAEREKLVQAQRSQWVAISYEPRADCFFNGDDPLQTMRKVLNLLVLRTEPVKPWPPLAELDPYACNLRFECIAGASRADVSTLFRLVPDQVRIVDIPSSVFAPAGGEHGSDVSLISSIIQEQLRMLHMPSQSEDFAGRFGSAARSAGNALRHGKRENLAANVDRAGAEAIASKDAGLLIGILERALAQLAPAPEPPAASEASTPKAVKPDRTANQAIRVDESKIDALGNLAGELVVLRNALSHVVRQVEAALPGQDIARAARREAEALERLSGELHGAILQLRMVPLSQAFRPFPRLGRDMAQRLDKKISVIVEGETTEADKRIVDRLHEPLLHLVRNAIDHGIETPEDRARAGKPDVATVLLRGTPAGRRVIIEVTDDGRGIDPAIIRRKAAERGVVSQEELAAMLDEQVVDLIFASGLSTAQQVSDISGRGVGMDVVRKSIEQMEGRVSITTAVGRSTTVRLDLPANIAMTHVMVVEAGGQVFGIPMDGVSETIRLAPDRITRVKGNEGFVLRDTVVPICSLAELMNLPEAQRSESAARLLLITEHEGKSTAVQVDAIVDRLQAILRPMQGVLATAHGYAGTTFLGDGRVLLVLDIKGVLP